MENVIEDKLVLTDVPDVEEILNALKKTKHLEKYRVEFIKILDLVKDARDVQEHLLNKWRETKTELSMKQEHLEEAQKRLRNEEACVENLKQDLAKAFKSVADFERKSTQAAEEVEELKAEIINLKASFSEKEKKKLAGAELDIETIREMKELRSTVENLRTELGLSHDKLKTVEEALSDALQLVHQHEKELTLLKGNLEKELERNIRVEKARLNAQKALREKENRLNSLKGKLALLKKSCSSLESGVESHKLRVVNFQRRNKELHALFKNSQKSLGEQIQKMHLLNQEKTVYLANIQKKDEEIETLQEKIANHEKSQSGSAHKISTLAQKVKDSNLTITLLKMELASSVKDMNAVLAKRTLSEKEIAHLKKEKETLENNVIKLEKLVQQCMTESKQVLKEKSSLIQELKSTGHIVEMQKHSLQSHENEQQKLQKELESLKKKIEEVNCKVDFHKHSASTIKQDKEKLEKDFKVLCSANESLVSDLALYYQWYKGAKDSLSSLTSRLQEINSQSGELSRSAEKKNVVISGLVETVDKFAKRIMLSENRVSELKDSIKALKGKLKEQELRSKKCLRGLTEKENQFENLRMKMKTAVQNCESLETTLSLKNNKITDLNHEVKKLESEVLKSEHRRMILENDIKLMKQEWVNLCRDKTMLTEKLSKLEKVEHILNQTQKELVQERVRGSALETEMQHPWNIHRWRLLEGTDPERYHLLMKQNFLQKRLINKTMEVQKKEQELNEKGQVVKELKSLVTKQSESDNKEKIIELRWQLREKNDKIKVLTGQVNMYESHISSYKAEIAELREKLKNCKISHYPLRPVTSDKTVNREYNLSD